MFSYTNLILDGCLKFYFKLNLKVGRSYFIQKVVKGDHH